VEGTTARSQSLVVGECRQPLKSQDQAREQNRAYDRHPGLESSPFFDITVDIIAGSSMGANRGTSEKLPKRLPSSLSLVT
jgi:hypothetical protein